MAESAKLRAPSPFIPWFKTVEELEQLLKKETLSDGDCIRIRLKLEFMGINQLEQLLKKETLSSEGRKLIREDSRFMTVEELEQLLKKETLSYFDHRRITQKLGFMGINQLEQLLKKETLSSEGRKLIREDSRFMTVEEVEQFLRKETLSYDDRGRITQALTLMGTEELEQLLKKETLSFEWRELIRRQLSGRQDEEIWRQKMERREEERRSQEEERRRKEKEETRREQQLGKLKLENPEQCALEQAAWKNRKDNLKTRQEIQNKAAATKDVCSQWLLGKEGREQRLETEMASLQQELSQGVSKERKRTVEQQLQEMAEEIQEAKQMQLRYKSMILENEKQLQQVAQERHAESKQLLDEAMQNGYIVAQICKCLLEGLAGAGKSSLKRLLLGMKPAILRVSTGCLERPIRAVSGVRIETSGEHWRELTADDLTVMVADVIPLLCDQIACKMELPSELSEALQKLLPASSPDASNDTQDEAVPPHSRQPEATPTHSLQPEVTPTHSPQPAATPIQATTQDDSLDTRQPTGSTPSPAKLATSAILSNIIDRIVCELESGQLISIPIVHVLDTGGQPPFHEVMSIFSKHTSVALLVFRLSERLDARPMVEYYDASGQLVGTPHRSPLTCEQVVEVMARSLQSSPTDGKLPKVVVVGTHKDKESECPNETQQQKNEKLRRILCPVMQDELIFYGDSFEELIFPVNTMGRGEEEERIAKMLRQEIEKCYREVKIPIWWFILEFILRHLAEQLKRRVLSRQECLEVAGLLKFHEKAFNAALNFLNEQNIFLHYPEILPEVVFTDSQVPVDKVSELIERRYRLLTANKSRQQKPSRGRWVKFRDQGIIAFEFLMEFPKHYVDGLFTPADLARLLTQLLIFAPISDDEYFMPIVLDTLSRDELHEHRVFSSAAAPLLISFLDGWPGLGVFCCLVVFLINQCRWQIVHPSGSPIPVFKNCIEFRLPKSPCTLTLIDATSHFEVHICAPPPICRKVCPSVKDAILTGIDAAMRNHGYSGTPVVACFCPHPVDSSQTLPVTSSTLHAAIIEEYPWWMCTENSKIYGELNNQQRVWFSEEDSHSAQVEQKGQTQKPVQSSAPTFPTTEAIHRAIRVPRGEIQEPVQSFSTAATAGATCRETHSTLSTDPELLSCGVETQQYQRLFSNFPLLLNALSPLVSAEALADILFFSARLITRDIWEEASVGGITNTSKLRLLMKSVLSQVELNAANYDKFVTVLTHFSGLEDVVKLLEIV